MGIDRYWLPRQGASAALRALSAFGAGATDRAVRAAGRLPAAWHDGVRAEVKRRGLVYELALDDNAQRYLFHTGWYERRFLQFLLSNLRANDVVVDIGAHMGIHALPMAARLLPVGGRVIAFEPSPDTAAHLRRGIDTNRLPNVEVVQTALGDSATTASLKLDSRFSVGDRSVRSLFADGETVWEVPVQRFDDWRVGALDRMDVVKIDVEGSEMRVLRGMSEALDELRPRLVAVEIRGFLLQRAGTGRDEIAEFLRDRGYRSTGTVLDANEIFRPESASD